MAITDHFFGGIFIYDLRSKQMKVAHRVRAHRLHVLMYIVWIYAADLDETIMWNEDGVTWNKLFELEINYFSLKTRQNRQLTA